MKPRYRLTLELATFPSPAGDSGEAAGASGERRLQINLRGILAAFAWTAVWGAGWASSEWLIRGSSSSLAGMARQIAFCILLLTPPAAAVGALVGRQWLGIACGAASAASLALWIMLNN